jgi:hypothetical protein
MSNLLLEEIKYKIDETPGGVWRRYANPTGEYFAEYKSHMTFVGLPLVHYTRGKCPETGQRIVARGVIAIGRLAVGIVAIGHASFGVCAVGQLALGVGFGLGQAATGFAAIGQAALGLLLGVGQLATGYIAVGQLVLGKYVLATAGYGKYMWSMERMDPEAVKFFADLVPFL